MLLRAAVNHRVEALVEHRLVPPPEPTGSALLEAPSVLIQIGRASLIVINASQTAANAVREFVIGHVAADAVERPIDTRSTRAGATVAKDDVWHALTTTFLVSPTPGILFHYEVGLEQDV